MVVTGEHLKKLFEAFRDRNDLVFERVAEAIIAEELAANHHNLANELRKTLDQRRGSSRILNNQNHMSLLPKDRRSGEELIALQESSIDQTQIVLGKETKNKVQRILEEYRNRNKLARYGYTPKYKLLFWGPPGCGKTHTAFYLGYELGLPVGIVRLNAIISSFLGDTASHLQRVFDMASKNRMVLLLDEVDAIGKDRDDPNDIGELKRIVNSFLQAMDSFHFDQSILINASNHQYLLDPALWRRFDDIIHFPLPGRQEREHYLKILLSGVRFEGLVSDIAKLMNSVSFADIKRIAIEAIKTMILDNRDSLRTEDLLEQFEAHKKAVASARSKK